MNTNTEDTEFWQNTIKDVEPLKPRAINKSELGAILLKTTQENLSSVGAPKIKIHHRRHYAAKQEFSGYSKALEDMEFGGIDKATLKKFKQEEFKTEAILDLHGCHEDDAFAKVEDFISRCYDEGKRCIIIITGKGAIHQPEDIYAPHGILKRQAPLWLNSPRIRALILVFKNPSEKLGGSGALYILLKRNRKIEL